MEIDSVSIILRCVFVNIFSYIFFYKFVNRKAPIWKYIILVLISTIAYMWCKHTFITAVSIIFLCFFQAILIKLLDREKINNEFLGVIVSMSFTYIVLFVSVTIEFLFQLGLCIENNTINVLITEIIASLIVYFILKLKKIKNGLSFLKRENENIDILLINICIVTAILIELISYHKGDGYVKNLFFLFIMLGLCMSVTIYKTMNIYYKQKVMENTIKDYETDINAKDKEIKRLTEENYKVHKVNHEFYNRQKALEKTVRETVGKMNMEVGEELSILGRIEEMTKEHSKSMESIRTTENIKKTEIAEVDEMFSYMLDECNKIGIEFNLKVEGNIFSMVNNLIPKEKLVTLIGDHIRDAIIAVNSSNNVNKRILSIIGKVNDNYEFCVFDSGIEFDANVLDKLGEEQITTHKDDGGSGIGFITTFETMKECKASLEIEEIGAESKSDYTKSVKIVFDGNNEYRIISYRAEELEKSLNKNRIKIKKIE